MARIVLICVLIAAQLLQGFAAASARASADVQSAADCEQMMDKSCCDDHCSSSLACVALCASLMATGDHAFASAALSSPVLFGLVAASFANRTDTPLYPPPIS